jgi:hypothetical protein
MSDADEISKKIADLQRQLNELQSQLPSAEPKFEPNEALLDKLRNYNPSEGLRMPASAAKPMADLIHGKGPKQDAQAIKNAWARNRLSEPGGFGAPSGPGPVKEVDRSSGGWVDPPKLKAASGTGKEAKWWSKPKP